MTFTSVFIIVITSGIVFLPMGYCWGKKDAGLIITKKQPDADKTRK